MGEGTNHCRLARSPDDPYTPQEVPRKMTKQLLAEMTDDDLLEEYLSHARIRSTPSECKMLREEVLRRMNYWRTLLPPQHHLLSEEKQAGQAVDERGTGV